MPKWKKILGIVIVVVLAFIIVVSLVAPNNNEDNANKEIVSSNKKINKLGLVITDKEIEEYNEYGDLVSLKSGTYNFEFTYTYDNDRIVEMTGICNNQPTTSSNMKITYNDSGNVNTLVSETPNLNKYNLQYIYDNDNNLQRIECIMTGNFGNSKHINYYYTRQNIKGTDYIIEEIVDMSTQKTTSIIVAKDIEYDMSSKLIGNYFMPIPYIYYSENLTFNNSNVKSYMGVFNFQTFSPVLLKNIIYEQGKTYSDNHKYYNKEFQPVLQSGEGFKHFYNYEKINDNEYNVLELLRDLDYNNTDGNGNFVEIYKQRKYKITYGNFEIPNVEIVEEKQIDYSTYNSLVKEYEENAYKNAVIYGVKLNSWKDNATKVDNDISNNNDENVNTNTNNSIVDNNYEIPTNSLNNTGSNSTPSNNPITENKANPSILIDNGSGSSTTNENYTLEYSVSNVYDNAEIIIKQNNNVISQKTITSNNTLTENIVLIEGSNNIEISVTNSAGKTSTQTKTITYTISTPKVTIDTSSASVVRHDNQYNFSYSYNDGYSMKPVNVIIKLNGKVVKEKTNVTAVPSETIYLEVGENVIEVIVTNYKGKSGSATKIVTYTE